MKLSKKNASRHLEILRRVKAGIPLAGLLSGMAVLTGCDQSLQPVGIEPRHVPGEPPEPVTRTAGEEPIALAGDVPAPVNPPPTNSCPAPKPAPAPLAGEPPMPPPTTGLPLPPKSPKGK